MIYFSLGGIAVVPCSAVKQFFSLHAYILSSKDLFRLCCFKSSEEAHVVMNHCESGLSYPVQYLIVYLESNSLLYDIGSNDFLLNNSSVVLHPAQIWSWRRESYAGIMERDVVYAHFLILLMCWMRGFTMIWPTMAEGSLVVVVKYAATLVIMNARRLHATVIRFFCIKTYSSALFWVVVNWSVVNACLYVRSSVSCWNLACTSVGHELQVFENTLFYFLKKKSCKQCSYWLTQIFIFSWEDRSRSVSKVYVGKLN